MDNKPDLDKIEAFLTKGNGPIRYDKLQAHMLYGWKWNTILLYNGGVKKFLRFKNETLTEDFELPATVKEIYDFCLCSGRTRYGPTTNDVLSITVSKYLHGLKAWHLYHLEEFPPVDDKVIKQILIASKRLDSTLPKKEGKRPVLIQHLVHLAVELSKRGERELAVLDTILVAFWGLARLGEVSGEKKDTTEIIRRGDVEISEGVRREAKIALRGAKTARVGEIQFLQVRELNHLLCPIAAIERRITRTSRLNDPLFSYFEGGGKRSLTKATIMDTCQKCWQTASYKGLTGHSFRVGGASFRFALGVNIEEICLIGRWKSEAYRLYIKAYSKKETAETLKLLNELENNKLH